MRPRKPCNCTKSQCLKLYCDCFANGEFCHLCNCTNCSNNLTHEEDRQKVNHTTPLSNEIQDSFGSYFSFVCIPCRQSSLSLREILAHFVPKLERVLKRERLMREDTIRAATVADPDASKTTVNVMKPKSFVLEFVNVRVAKTVLRIYPAVFQMGLVWSNILPGLGPRIGRH